MSNVPLHKLADRFVKHIPSEFVFLGIEDAKQAGTLLQRLATGLAPSVEGGLTLTEENLRQFTDLYVQNSLVKQVERKPLGHIFGNCLLRHAPRVKQQGVAFLAEEMRISPDDLLQALRAAGKTMPGSVFKNVENVGLGLRHTFSFRHGLKGTNWGAGALGYGGAFAVLDGARRALIGTDVTPLNENGYPQGDYQTQRHWLAGATEAATGLGAIAAALKIAENNIARLK